MSFQVDRDSSATGGVFAKDALVLSRWSPDYVPVLRLDLGQRRLLAKTLGAPLPCDCQACRSRDIADFGWYSSYK